MTLPRVSVFAVALFLAEMTQSQTAETNPVTFAYSGQITPFVRSVLWRSPQGVTYRLSLMSDDPPGHHASLLELVLNPVDKSPSLYGSLLDWTGMLHGYQPYDFGPWDYDQGVDKSSYGRKRTIELKKLGMGVSIVVTAARVHRAPNRLDDYFEDLTIKVLARPLH